MQDAEKKCIVQKFGGSSLADAEHFKIVKSLLIGKDEIIVVSAVKDITSSLQALLDASQAKKPFKSHLQHIEKQHITLIQSLISSEIKSDELVASLQADCNIIKDILHAVELVNASSKETQDLILGYGEQWSAKILTAYLDDAIYLDAATVLFTYEKNGALCIDWERSQHALNAFL